MPRPKELMPYQRTPTTQTTTQAHALLLVRAWPALMQLGHRQGQWSPAPRPSFPFLCGVYFFFVKTDTVYGRSCLLTIHCVPCVQSTFCHPFPPCKTVSFRCLIGHAFAPHPSPMCCLCSRDASLVFFFCQDRDKEQRRQFTWAGSCSIAH